MSKKAHKQFSVLVYWCLQDMYFIVYVFVRAVLLAFVGKYFNR